MTKYYQQYDETGFVIGCWNDKDNSAASIAAAVEGGAVEVTETEFNTWEGDKQNRVIDTTTKKPKNKPAKDAAEQLADTKQGATTHIDNLKTQKAFYQLLLTTDLDAQQAAIDAAGAEADVQAVLDALP